MVTPLLSYPQSRDAVASKNNDNLAQSLEIARFEGLVEGKGINSLQYVYEIKFIKGKACENVFNPFKSNHQFFGN